MKGIDTNIPIRFFADDEVQTKKVYAMFKQAESGKRELFVPLLVLLEMVWVLNSAYGIPRAKILESICDLLLMPVLKFEQQAVIQQFVHSAGKTNFDLSGLSLPTRPGPKAAIQWLLSTSGLPGLVFLSWWNSFSRNLFRALDNPGKAF